MIARLFAVCLALFAAGLALADHCAAPVRVVQQYHAPTYHQQAYYPPHYVPVQISPDYYYSTNSAYERTLLAEATAAKTAQLFLDGLRAAQVFGQVQIQQQSAPLIQQPAPPPQAKGTPVSPALANLIAARCLKCHSGAEAKGGVNFDNLSTTPKAIRRKATSLACLGEMPPTGPELTHEEIALLKAWMRAAE